MRSEKQLLLDEIRDRIKSSKGLFLVRYQGLKADGAESIRNSLRANGGEFEVVRKRVFMKAAAAAEVEVDRKVMEGHMAIVFTGPDLVQTAKTLVDFQKESGGTLEVVAAQLEGQTYSAASVEKLSKMPGIQELRAQLLGLFAAPMSQTVGVMQAMLTSMLYCLENRAKAIAE